MASIKSLIEPQCGTQAPLVSLSSNFAQSTSSSSQFDLLPSFTSHTDLSTQEFLRNISSETSLPNSFNMSTLLQNYQSSSSLKDVANILKSPENRNNNIDQKLVQYWTNEFEQRLRQSNTNVQHSKFAVNLPNTMEYIRNIPQTPLTNAWNLQSLNSQQIIHPLAVSASLSPMTISQQSSKEWASDFLKKFDSLAIESSMQKGPNVDAWVEEFTTHQSDASLNVDYKEMHDDAYEVFSRYESEWENIKSDLTAKINYTFNEHNSFLNESNPLTKAKEFFSQGNISDSILCYEAALQQNPTDAESWCSLGLCHAENEQDVKAITAFKRSLELEPLNRRTLLASAVSLANEGGEITAIRHLDQWIQQFTNESVSSTNASNAFVDDMLVVDESWIRRLEEKFLNAASMPNLTTERLSELHNAQGIFYNLTHHYDKAIDSLHSAISANPDNAVLWNRLGASLANSDRSPEAIGAYRKALELFPSYVRARYNLGVSCMNMSAYREAIGHFIGALKLQKSEQNVQIWSKLRSCVLRIFSDLSLLDGENLQYMNDALNAIETRDLDTVSRICG